MKTYKCTITKEIKAPDSTEALANFCEWVYEDKIYPNITIDEVEDEDNN